MNISSRPRVHILHINPYPYFHRVDIKEITACLRDKASEVHHHQVSKSDDIADKASSLLTAYNPDLVMIDISHNIKPAHIREVECELVDHPMHQNVVFVTLESNKRDITETEKIPTLRYEDVAVLKNFTPTEYAARRVKKNIWQKTFGI